MMTIVVVMQLMLIRVTALKLMINDIVADESRTMALGCKHK